MTVRKTLGGASCIFDPTVRTLPLISNRPTSLMVRNSLTAFPFNKIKIDKSFIADLTRNYKSTAIVCTIVTLASGLDMQVTVEGVETREQLERLKALGVNFAQGFLMGQPVPADELERQPQVYRPRQDAA